VKKVNQVSKVGVLFALLLAIAFHPAVAATLRASRQQRRIEVATTYTLRVLRGVVLIKEKPVPNSRVQVFKVVTRRVGGRNVQVEGSEFAWKLTDELGRFSFDKLSVGRYRLLVQSKGFQEIYFANVKVNPTRRGRRILRVMMEVAT
jgi:hypothetical protein